ncbi:MAG: beta-lactamase family protein [Oscillospiraceae bacterium]|nr:beta-lactamase family protein [Oscillospiraceae bacterium]
MKKFLLFFLSVLTITVSVCFSGCSQQEKASDSNLDTADSKEINTVAISEQIDEALQQTGFKGIVYISNKGKEVYNNGLGKANIETSAMNTSDTEFSIASNTKQFTAAAIMILQQKGKLSVDDTIDKFFPSYKEGKKLTIHNLLSMRSGIPDYFTYTDENGNRIALTYSMLEYQVKETSAPKDNRKNIREWIFKQPLNFKADEKFEYSNSNYFLLADIIESVSETTYESFVKTNIFDPLKMENSYFADNYNKESEMFARPNDIDYDTEYLNYPGASFGAGNIISTAKDIDKWLNEYSNPQILNDESIKAMTQNYSKEGDMLKYGYGLMIADEGSFYHTGYLPSYNSMFIVKPQSNTNIILMSNYSFGGIETLGNRIERELSEK